MGSPALPLSGRWGSGGSCVHGSPVPAESSRLWGRNPWLTVVFLAQNNSGGQSSGKWEAIPQFPGNGLEPLFSWPQQPCLDPAMALLLSDLWGGPAQACPNLRSLRRPSGHWLQHRNLNTCHYLRDKEA